MMFQPAKPSAAAYDYLHGAKEAPKISIGNHFVSLMSLLLILMVETCYSRSLFDSSLSFIIKIQDGASSAGVTLWQIYSNIGLGAAVGLPPFILYTVYWDRLHSFFYIVNLTAMLTMMNVTKLWYHQERPFWVDKDIEAYDCTTQFGNPSGHSLFSMGAAMTMWLDFNERYKDNENSKFQPIWVRLAALFLALIFAFTIGYSRVFLGAHSWNQLLFGWQLGLWISLTFYFCY